MLFALTLFEVKWDTPHTNPIFRNQSALLYASYYTVQITVHRSFVPLPRRPAVLPFPSLAICTNAARSCLRVLEKQLTQVISPTLFLHWHQVCRSLLLYIIHYALIYSTVDVSVHVLGAAVAKCLAREVGGRRDQCSEGARGGSEGDEDITVA